MLELALALAPGIAISVYVYIRDQYDREPLKNLLISFLLGAVSTIPAVIVQLSAEPLLKKLWPENHIAYLAIFAFVVVGFSEEASKFLMLRTYAFRKKAFNEPFDGIIYSVMVSMGFATLENIGYVAQGGITTALLRMFLSVPAHASFGVIMGYYAGLAKFDPARSVGYLWKGVLLATLFHGAFDFFLFLQNSQQVTRFVSGSLLFSGAVLSYAFAVRISLRSIKLHQELSRKKFTEQNGGI